jgi:hypothetical protein
MKRLHGRLGKLKQHGRKLLLAEGLTQQFELVVLEQRFCFNDF